MQLPISFDEVGYFHNEYRGDLIVTLGVIYYFPHTRTAYARFSRELKGEETAERIGLLGNIIPIISVAPWAFEIADSGVKLGKFLKRSFAPSINKARIRQMRLWHGNETSEALQAKLDAYIMQKREEPVEFEEDSVPKPMRFAADEVKDLKLGLKLKFDAKFDNHDFRINPVRRSLLRKTLKEAGFL